MLIEASTLLGVISGAGRFLQENDFDGDGMTITHFSGTYAPKQEFCGVYFAFHFGNFYVNAPEEVIRYVEELALWGVRFFYCLGQGACRTATLGDRWFTAKAPYIYGKYNSPEFNMDMQLPWIGDSCTVECAGMGGFAAAASPIVCNLRGLQIDGAIEQSREMEKITVAKNGNYPIPTYGFDGPPCAIDMLKVVKTGITPCIHGGMIAKDGGILGAGMARIPMECFEKALAAYAEKYGLA